MPESKMIFDFLFYRMEMKYEPTWTMSGMSVQTQVHVYYIGLNAGGDCERGVRYGGTGAIVTNAKGTYEINGTQVQFSWSDGGSEGGLLSEDRSELVVGGVAYRAGANTLASADWSQPQERVEAKAETPSLSQTRPRNVLDAEPFTIEEYQAYYHPTYGGFFVQHLGGVVFFTHIPGANLNTSVRIMDIDGGRWSTFTTDKGVMIPISVWRQGSTLRGKWL